MDIGITIVNGWALVKKLDTGQTAICAPSMGDHSLLFECAEWYEEYDDALIAVSTMAVVGLTVQEWKRRKRAERKAERYGTGFTTPQGTGEVPHSGGEGNGHPAD